MPVPLYVEMALHFHCTRAAWTPTSPAASSVVEDMVKLELLLRRSDFGNDGPHASYDGVPYSSTSELTAYVNRLLDVTPIDVEARLHGELLRECGSVPLAVAQALLRRREDFLKLLSLGRPR